MKPHAIEPLHRQPRRFLRLLLASAAAGAAVGFLMWLGDPRSPLRLSLALSAWVGAWIFLASDLLLTILARPFGRLRPSLHTPAMAVLFFGSGVLGWWLAARILTWVTLGRFQLGTPASWWITIAFAGGVGAVIGLLLYLAERLRDRLAESVARIKEQEFAEKELATARELQQRLLPPRVMTGAGWSLAALNLPAHVVAGDFYDYFQCADGALGLAVGDVAGKGMGASLVMASVKGMLPLVAAERDPAAALAELNRRLAAQLPARQFVALCLVRYRPATGELELANGGLPDPYVLSPGHPPRALAAPGPRLPLGLHAEVAYEPRVARLGPGERLLLISDGLPEAPTVSGEPLGYGAFEELLGELPGPPKAALDELCGRLERRSRPLREDDWTALLLERQRLIP